MADHQRHRPARQAPVGYPHGPDAPLRATDLAMTRVAAAQAVIMVEGVSDQIAVETLARRQGRDLTVDGVAVLPVGGAGAIASFARQLGPDGDNLTLVGLYDADAADTVARTMRQVGIGAPWTVDELADIGFHRCDRDLEDELIRAVGPRSFADLIEIEGELDSFRRFQRQPQWRGRPLVDQYRRFLGSRSTRSARYAQLALDTLDPAAAPAPLRAVLDEV